MLPLTYWSRCFLSHVGHDWCIIRHVSSLPPHEAALVLCPRGECVLCPRGECEDCRPLRRRGIGALFLNSFMSQGWWWWWWTVLPAPPCAPSWHGVARTPGRHVTNRAPGRHVTNMIPGSHVTNRTPGRHVTNRIPGRYVTNRTPGRHVTNRIPGRPLECSWASVSTGVG